MFATLLSNCWWWSKERAVLKKYIFGSWLNLNLNAFPRRMVVECQHTYITLSYSTLEEALRCVGVLS